MTQVVVDKDDPKFKNPSKPIGPFYSESEAMEIASHKGYTMKEDSGRGWRRVVASPLPVEIVELKAVECLADNGFLVITVGGGGIPVIRNANGELEGVAAVIDKDLASEKLAEDLDADTLMILTAVEKVCINYGKPDQLEISETGCQYGAEIYLGGAFRAGSMRQRSKPLLNSYSAKVADAQSLHHLIRLLTR